MGASSPTGSVAGVPLTEQLDEKTMSRTPAAMTAFDQVDGAEHIVHPIAVGLCHGLAHRFVRGEVNYLCDTVLRDTLR